MKHNYKISYFLLLVFFSPNLPAQDSISQREKNEQIISLSEGALFYIENNSVKNMDELHYKPKNKFEINLLTAVIEYKQNKFSNAYNMLKTLLKNTPEDYSYFEYLAKSAHILNKDSELKSLVDSRCNYLAGIIDFLNADYNSASEKFQAASKTKSNSSDILLYLSNTYRKLGDYGKANQTLENAQSLVDKANPVYSEILIAKGSLFFLSGQYEKAQEIYEAGLKLAEKTHNNVEKIKAKLNLGMITDLYGNSELAQDYFAQAYSLSHSIDQKELEAIVLSEWGVSFTYLSMPVKARNKYEESYDLLKEFNNYDRMALAAINIANQFLNINNYQSALKKYNLALKIAGENLRTQMLAYRGLGDVYTNLSSYAKALEFYNRAKEISRQIKDISAETEINIGIGTLFYNLRKYIDALDIIMDTYDDVIESENPYLKAELNQKAGIINLSLQNYNEAEKYLSAAIKLSDNYDDIYSSILSNTYLAYTLINNEKITEGKEILLNQIKLCNEYSLHQLLGIQYLILAEISKSNNHLKYLNKAMENSILANDKSTLTSIYKTLGEHYELNQEYSAVEKEYLNAIAIIEKTQKVLGSNEQIQIDYFSDKSDVYKPLAKLYIKMGENKKAFAVIDKSRSRNTMYNLSAIKLASSQNNQLVNSFYDLQWKYANNLIEDDKIDSVKSKLSWLEKELDIEDLKTSDKFTKEDIANYLNEISLDEDEVYVKYHISSSDVYVFLVKKDNFSLVKLPTTATEITKNISLVSPYYNSEFNNNKISFNRDLFAFKTGESYELYKKIFKPIISQIPKNSKIILSLPNKLLNIPFEFLCTEKDNPKQHYLVEEYSISYSPSLAILENLKTDSHNENSFALIAGDPNLGKTNEVSETRGATRLDLYARNINLHPLKYSLDEVETIEQYFSNNMLLLGNEATETNFVLNAEKASVIHLSTHSFLFQNNPVVLLSEDEVNDGYLEIGEIANLKLNSDLVVLSSCKSGLGQIEANEGIIGMQKAFFDVGASSVILSLWDVSDEHTAQLMKYFYGYLSDGYDNSIALQKAKIKFIKEVDSNPYYWAAFTLAGNVGKVKMDKGNSSSYWVLLILFVLAVFVYYLIKTKKFYNVKVG